jgi:tetratricopeptide (TPR) repeat protein
LFYTVPTAAVPHPSVRRSAVALEDGTMVLAVGGKSGEVYTPSAWEAYFAAERFRASSDWDGMAADLQAALVDFPDNPGVLYALACATTLAGEHEEGLAYLERSIALDPSQVAWAHEDDDLASLRDLPGFPAAPPPS